LPPLHGDFYDADGNIRNIAELVDAWNAGGGGIPNALKTLTDSENNVYEVFNESDGGGIVANGSQYECGICINGGNGAAGNYPQIYFDSWSLPGTYNTTAKTWTHNGTKSRMLIQAFPDGLKGSVDGANWSASALKALPAYAGTNLKDILVSDGESNDSFYYATNATTAWTFAFPLAGDYTLRSVDGGSRMEISASAQTVSVYFEDNLTATLTADSPTYTFIGEALYRGYDCLGYDLGGHVIPLATATLDISVTQNALVTGLEDIVASIANLFSQVASQRAREVADLTAASLNAIKIKPLHTKLVMVNTANAKQEYWVYHYPELVGGQDVYFGFGVALDGSLNPLLSSFRTVGSAVTFYATLPVPPTVDGTTTLKCTVTDGVAVYSWA
jgi:hypothetical protein